MESSSNNITDVNGSKLGDGRSHSVLESRGGLTPGGEPNQPTHGSWDEESTNRMNATAKSLSHTAAYTMEHKKVNGKYPEVPHLLDKYRILNRAPAEEPQQVYRVNLSNQNLTYVVESDLAVFNNLETLNVSENKLNFARLGALPGLKRLIMSLNDVKSLDLDVSGRFMNLTSLDLSFNSINESAQILLATLPCLQSLDLTCNNIATLSNKILDMNQWQDVVIEHLLPDEVVQIDRELGSGPNPKEHETGLVPAGSYIGFSNLTFLSLENNNLGGSDHFWSILINLPRLAVLNLNDNKISNLNFLKHEKIVKKDPTELLRWNPSLLPIYGGFPCLTDLHLAKNAIKDIDALVAIICFKSLKSVFLESNPVMLTYHVRQRDPDEFNLFLHLDKSYGIRISDPIFKKQNEILDRIKFKQSHLLAQPRKKAIPAVLGQKANPHHVSAMSSQKLTKQRKMRRKYKFTEDDVKQVIASGKIPSMRALLRKRKEEKKLADAIEDENDNYQSSNFSFHPEIQDQTFMTSVHITQEDDQASLSIQDDDGSMLSWSEPEESESEEEDVPDFNLPSTIQGSIKALQHALNNPVSYWRIMENSYLKPTHSTIAKAYLKSWDQEFKIPKNDVREMEEEESETASIKSSLSSGKMSHNNNTPWLDEEIEEEFFLIPQKSLNVQTYYAKEGHMSYLSKSELQARPDLINAQSHYVKEGSMSYLSKQDLDLINANSSRRQSSLGISRRSSLAVKGLTHDFRLRQVQKAAAQRRASELKIQLKSLRRARDEGRLRPKDEFEEMNELMNEVEEKVKSVEARLGNFKSNAGNVLKSKSIESHIPKSTKALSNLQREYSRIAALYITDAERIVQQEPLSARLQKLGMDKKH